MNDTKKRSRFLDIIISHLSAKEYPIFTLGNVDLDMFTEIKESLEGEMILRRLLWIRHGCPFPALYGDDGEMSCGMCRIDFKRTLAKDIQSRFNDIATRKLQEETPSEPPEDLVDGLLQAGIDSVIEMGVGFDEPRIDEELGKEKIRKLLQGQAKPSVTRLQIKAMIVSLHNMEKQETMEMFLASMFQSRGVKEAGKCEI